LVVDDIASRAANARFPAFHRKRASRASRRVFPAVRLDVHQALGGEIERRTAIETNFVSMAEGGDSECDRDTIDSKPCIDPGQKGPTRDNGRLIPLGSFQQQRPIAGQPVDARGRDGGRARLAGVDYVVGP